MKATKVVIDHHQWMLPQDVDLPALKAEVGKLVRAGGGLLHFDAAGDREISALVTKGIPVYFEVVEVADDYEDHEEGSGYQPDDFDV